MRQFKQMFRIVLETVEINSKSNSTKEEELQAVMRKKNTLALRYFSSSFAFQTKPSKIVHFRIHFS